MEVKLILKRHWDETVVIIKGHPPLVEKLLAAIKAVAKGEDLEVR